MAANPPGRLPGAGAFWFALSVFGSLSGVWVSVRALARYTDPPPGGYWFVLVGLALIVIAGYAAWRLARAGMYSWLLPLAAVNLVHLVTARRYRWQA